MRKKGAVDSITGQPKNKPTLALAAQLAVGVLWEDYATFDVRIGIITLKVLKRFFFFTPLQ